MAKRGERRGRVARLLPGRVKGLREKKGYTMGQLARYSGLSVSTISRLESGERPNTQSSTVAKLATTFKTTVEYLVGNTDDPSLPSGWFLTEEEWRLILLFRQLDARRKRELLSFTEWTVRQKNPHGRQEVLSVAEFFVAMVRKERGRGG